MMNINWTEEQRLTIEDRGNNLLVSAAAGSGKTAVLVERIKRLIIEDRVPIDSMLIVTFTNAAASEMRFKIIDAINKELQVSEDDFLIEQLENLPQSQISTFHAFAKEVIQRYFYLIDVEPSFSVADESQVEFLKNEAIDELFEQEFNRNNDGFKDLLYAYATSKSEDTVKEMLLSCHKFVQSLPERFAWFDENVEKLNYDEKHFKESRVYSEIKSDVIQSLNSAIDYFEKVRDILYYAGVESKALKINIDIENVKKSINAIEEGQDLFLTLNEITFERLSSKKEEKEAWESVKTAAEKTRSLGKDAIKSLIKMYAVKPLPDYIEDLHDTYKYAQELNRLLLAFDEIYSLKKQERGLVDFNDLEHYAIAILSHDEAAEEYRKKFNYIFIDEYQDSNLIQEALINRIKRDDNLFMVGDIKQSIYKFRLAEPELFIYKYEQFSSDPTKGKLINLDRNFRSKEPIIDEVNNIFENIITKETSGIAYDALNLGVECGQEFKHDVELCLVSTEDDETLDEMIREMQSTELEAAAVVKSIKSALGEEIFDSKAGVNRALRNRDIVILLRGVKNKASFYYNALMRAGIPAFMDSGEGYFHAIEIDTIINLLKVIDNKKQDLALVSVLYSIIYDFSTEDLIKIRLHNKKVAFYTAFESYSEEGEDVALVARVKKVLSDIENYKQAASFLPLDEFLWNIIKNTGYYDYAGALPSGLQRQANLRALVDKSLEYQDKNIKGLFGFIRYIEKIKENDIPIGQMKLVGENDDVVRITTIHKSKGLEFPMVIVAGLGQRLGGGTNDSRLSIHKDIGVSLRWSDPESSAYQKTIIQNIIERKKRKEEIVEEIRILYVALTRAMDKLLLVGSQRDDVLIEKNILDSRKYLEMLNPILGNTSINTVIYKRSDIESFIAEEIAEDEDLRVKIENAEDIHDSEIEKKLEYIYPYESEYNLKSKYTVTELNPKDSNIINRELSVPSFLQNEVELSAAEKGSYLHTILEHLDYEDAYKHRGEEEYLKSFCENLAEKRIISETALSVIDLSKISAYTLTDLFKRAAMASELYKEMPFNLKILIDGRETIVQGIIDLFFKEEGKYVLVDYKSGFNPDPLSSYSSQLALYKKALERIKKVEVKEVYLYLIDKMETIQIP